MPTPPPPPDYEPLLPILNPKAGSPGDRIRRALRGEAPENVVRRRLQHTEREIRVLLAERRQLKAQLAALPPES